MLKKLFFCAIIIVLIIAGIYVANKITNENETIKTGTNSTNKSNNEQGENNAIQNENTNLLENEIAFEDNNIDDTESPEEQAKEIVRNNWGEDDSVYFSYDGINNAGKYIICVRDKKTTKALFWYYIDIKTGSFDIE